MGAGQIILTRSWRLVTATLMAGLFLAGCSKEPPVPTYSQDIAPIIHGHCATCHRPGQSGPFNLLTYEDVAQRAGQIAEVTQSGYMPPWLPTRGEVRFTGERHLWPSQIRKIQEWAEAGAPRGDPAQEPTPPTWPDDWQLGTPDLVIRMAEPYTLPVEGRDVYRNFVVPIPWTNQTSTYVRAVVFRPHSKAVHHAFMFLDRTGYARRLDARDSEPGFEGMNPPPGSETPDGHFLSWQPGRQPSEGPPGLAWRLETGSDLLLQIHMQPTGRPETVQAEVGIYFTDQAPTNQLFKIYLASIDIDIPAGAQGHVVEDQYTLPVDLDLLAVLPHTHYLGQDLQGYAVLPGGRRITLMHIPEWDFNWQGDYRLASPLRLPRGTTLHMRYTYDNSEDNVLNPNQPPQRVTYGVNSSDEMAELWLQVLPVQPGDRAVLERDFQGRALRHVAGFNRHLLGLNPQDHDAHQHLGEALWAMGQTEEATQSFATAIQLAPNYDQPHYFMGLIHRRNQQPDKARQAFERALALNPMNARAHGNLGFLLMERQDLASAHRHLQEAVRLNPNEAISRDALGVVLFNLKRPEEAVVQFRKALELEPGNGSFRRHLEQARQALPPRP